MKAYKFHALNSDCSTMYGTALRGNLKEYGSKYYEITCKNCLRILLKGLTTKGLTAK